MSLRDEDPVISPSPFFRGFAIGIVISCLMWIVAGSLVYMACHPR